MSQDDAELGRLREQIRAVDKELVELTARRLALARQVGDLKRDLGQPIRNYVVEAEALKLVHDAAIALGVNPTAAEELLKIEIRESLRVQEKDRVGRRARAPGTAGKALVVGGAGNMGAWFAEFLESMGHEVSVADPRGSPHGRPLVKDVPGEAAGFELVLLATPPSATPGVLKSLHGRTRGLVADIASLKAPHATELRELAASGAKVASLHPMWGPKADLLASRNVVVCDCGNPAAAREARALFEDTAANIVEMPLEEHDRFMGLVLGLPHAVSLVFGHALAQDGTSYQAVSNLGGPTFQKQVAVSREVASENKDLYYEIQRLNPNTAKVLEGLRRSLDDLEASLGERERFRAYMGRAEAWFSGDSR
jgi:chorismate mutase/prephenate dehydrogenase